ncbi:MAG: hypothetical protein ABIT01_04460 [Thermoanaerobaculia bacterium]
MEQAQETSPRLSFFPHASYAAYLRPAAERLGLSVAVDLRRARVRLRRGFNWLMERDRKFSATSSSYVRGERGRKYSAFDLVLGEVGMLVACLLLLLGAGGGIPLPIALAVFLVSATLFAGFAKRAAEDLLSEVEPGLVEEIRASASE